MNAEQLKWIEEKLREAAACQMYGSLSFQFQNGALTGLEIKKTEKPPVDAKHKPK
jgi:hypothetical protein